MGASVDFGKNGRGKEEIELTYEGYVAQGLEGKAPLKLILCGEVQGEGEEKVGVVSVVFATEDREKAERRLRELVAANPEHYYMVYSVPLDVDLRSLPHYPSLALHPEDLQ